jgi:hypothetical protein
VHIRFTQLIVTGFLAATACNMGSPAAKTNSPTTILFQENFENGISKAWKDVKFSEKTLFQIIKAGTNSVLQAHAAGSASGLGIDQTFKMAPGLKFQWRWKIDKTPTGGTETDIKTFDHTARLFVAFESKIGPPRTINYVWANRSRVNQTFEHPRSSRARFVVLESGNEKAQQWMTEVRDLNKDWQMLFGNSDPPPIVGIGLVTDSDGTKDKVTAWYDDLTLFQEK